MDLSYLLQISQVILKASIVTIELLILTIVFSTPLGLIVALGKLSGIKLLKGILDFYTYIIRGTPLLLQILFIYFGLPTIGIKFNSFTAASLALVLNYTAYLAEIIRAGVQSIDKGQYEAAKVLGMDYKQTMRKIIVPQALKVVSPPICNEYIVLIKDTALVSVIGMEELLRATKEIVARDFNMLPFFVAAAIYLAITAFFTAVFARLEKKLSIYD